MFSSHRGYWHPKSDHGRGSLTSVAISMKMVLYDAKNLWIEEEKKNQNQKNPKHHHPPPKKNPKNIYRGTQNQGENQKATRSQAIMGDFLGNHNLQIKSTSCPGGWLPGTS